MADMTLYGHHSGPEADLVAVSLGGGVQSSTVCLLAAEGLIPAPDVAVFADTGWEPWWVYETVEWLTERCPFPVVTVTAGNLAADVAAGRQNDGAEYTPIPTYAGPGQMTTRQCTSRYKIAPIHTELKRRMGVTRGTGRHAIQMLGISLDETHRMRTDRLKWVTLAYPLIDLRMTRADCEDWWASVTPFRVPPKSSCVGCPYHSARLWVEIADRDPDAFAEACDIEADMQHAHMGQHIAGTRLNDTEEWLHRRRIPLRLAVEADRRAVANEDAQGSLFGEDCSGLCGV